MAQQNVSARHFNPKGYNDIQTPVVGELPLLATKVVPTDFGIAIAKECGMTLVSEASDTGLTVYCHSSRTIP
jgi:formate dehydrogenase assembly factor FdhD